MSSFNSNDGYKIKKLETSLADNTSKIGIFGRKAFYVESYYNLKIAVANGYDYAPCIQKAFDDASGTSSIVVFPSGQNLLVGSPIRIKGQNGNHIFGNRCVLTRTGLTTSSDSPILYYLGLTDIGGTSKSYNYNSGVYIHELKFMSDSGFGVGYKHAIAGQLYMYNCVFDSTLENGVVLSGTNGVHFQGCQFSGSKKGLFCAKVAEDSYTVNYTVEGTGWNDGIHIVGGTITAPLNGHGVYYSGSTSEGILVVEKAILIGSQSGSSTGIYARSFSNVIVEKCWSEYFNSGKVVHADADSTAGNYEPDSLVVSKCNFTNYSGSKPDYNIYSRAVRTYIDDCVFLNNPLTNHIFYSVGSANTLRINTAAQPTAIDTTNGTITFPKTGILDTRDLFITDGTNNYYLVFNADMGASGYKYNTYTYTTPMKRVKEWRFGTFNDEYYITRILTPTLSLSTTYTITSTDDSNGVCEVSRPIFQGLTAKANAVGYGGFGAIIVKNPMIR
jgi:hypothetical protein